MSSLKIVKYQNAKLENITYYSPYFKEETLYTCDSVKILKKIHFIDIMYKNTEFLLQTSKLSVSSIKQAESNILYLIIDSDMKIFINKLENHIINYIHANSYKIFKKIFTLEKISKGLVSNVNKDVLLTSVSKNCQIYNKSNELIQLADINKDDSVICILKIANLQFIDNKFTYNIIVEQTKVYKETKISEYSILSNSELYEEYYEESNTNNFFN